MTKDNLVKSVLGPSARIESPLLGGMMNDSSIILCDGKRYVLYVSTEQANEMVNRPLEKEHLQIVYKLGITSKNVYFDTEKGIKINEFIEGSSIDKIKDYDLKKVAKLFHILHNSPVLSPEDYSPFKRFMGYEEEALSFNKNPNEDYLLIRDELLKNKDYLERQTKVLCHNDAQKSNIVKGEDGNYYLIDFEFMGNNDPIYDIATFGNGSVKEGFDLLNVYFDHPTQDQIKRYYLWRMYVSLQWYDVAIVKHYRGEGEAHHFNFLDVASYFLNNAKEAYQGYIKNK